MFSGGGDGFEHGIRTAVQRWMRKTDPLTALPATDEAQPVRQRNEARIIDPGLVTQAGLLHPAFEYQRAVGAAKAKGVR